MSSHPLTAGRATSDATARFHARHAAAVVDDHVRRMGDLSLSSVGLGTYLGAADAATDERYAAAARRAIELGINVLDAAINYRHQRSERALGRALAGVARDEIVVTTKGGFLAFDGERPGDPRAYIERTVIAPGLAAWSDIAAGCHCLTPRFLADQIARSRANLGLATLDVYYLHNPETQLDDVDVATFHRRMRAAFEALEQARHDGALVRYGTATWVAYRQPPGARGHVDLATLVGLAREVGGDDHGFRVVQLPINPGMPEAVDAPTQGGASLLAAARDLGVYVMSSASIGQGKLGEPRTALDWVRTRPGLGTALVGMSRPDHVSHNAAVFRTASAASDQQ